MPLAGEAMALEVLNAIRLPTPLNNKEDDKEGGGLAKDDVAATATGKLFLGVEALAIP
jgi:hypothetical protein